MVLEERQDHAESTLYVVITKILNLFGGIVDQVRVTCCLDQFGIEIQVPSTWRDGSYSWIVISRGSNRNVDESWHGQDDPHQNIEMVSFASCEQSHAVTSSIEETHASKPGTTESDELPI